MASSILFFEEHRDHTLNISEICSECLGQSYRTRESNRNNRDFDSARQVNDPFWIGGEFNSGEMISRPQIRCFHCRFLSVLSSIRVISSALILYLGDGFSSSLLLDNGFSSSPLSVRRSWADWEG